MGPSRSEDPQDYVVRTLARLCGLGREVISLESRLLQDLGVDGDDAAEFIRRLIQDWNIDVSDFQIGQHFTAESAIAWWFLPGVRREANQKVPITVSQVIAAIKSGQLRSPAVESDHLKDS